MLLLLAFAAFTRVFESSEAFLGLPPFRSECFPDTPQRCQPTPPRTTLRAFLFTRGRRHAPEMPHLCGNALPRSTAFDPARNTVLLVPGFLFGICEDYTFQTIKDEILDIEDANVLLIDCRDEYGINYLTAVDYIQSVGKQIATILKNMQKEHGLKNEKVHLVGMSLGAHACSVVAKHFPVQRITGIDPAGPLFEPGTPQDRMLDRSDAPLVDVLHCNAGGLGISQAIGHVDFYVNGGLRQPSCLEHQWKSLSKSNFWVVVGSSLLPFACDHHRCLHYFTQSIKAEEGLQLQAWGCDSYEHFANGSCVADGPPTALMGYHFGKSFRPEGADHSLKYFLHYQL